MGIFVSILAFSFLVIVHEFGHLLAAKKFGVKVETFALGLGKPFIKFHWHGTDYGLAPFPFGGFCKMKGENASILEGENLNRTPEELAELEALKTAPDSYNSKKLWQKVIILASGALMNLLSALVILWVLSLVFMRIPLNTPVAGNILPNSPAAKAGMIKGDRFVGYMDPKTNVIRRDINKFSDLDRLKAAKVKTYLVKRGNKELTLTMSPAAVKDQYTNTTKIILGIELPSRGVTFAESFKSTGLLYMDSLDMIGNGFKLLFAKTTKIPRNEMVSGPVGIVDFTSKIANKAVSAGEVSSNLQNNYIRDFFYIWAVISINLGIINLLPIIPLDGGNIVLEAISPWVKKYNPLRIALKYVSMAGMASIIGLMLFATTNDVVKLFK